MDQVKIGAFIAECRKKHNLTQAELADKLNITDRAVSKWETGRSIPDAQIMLDLCEILQISVNELLSGEVLEMKEYNAQYEAKLLELVKEKQEADKKILKMEIFVGISSSLFLLIGILIAALVSSLANWQRILIIVAALVISTGGFLVALRLEQVGGYYECPECGHHYVPTFAKMLFAQHLGRTRKMKCPNCGKKAWQKKVLEK